MVVLLDGGQRPQNFFGDVDARAPEHRVLHDQVVLFGLGDLLDDAVGPIDQLLDFLVLALVEVFAEFTLLFLESEWVASGIRVEPIATEACRPIPRPWPRQDSNTG